MGILDVVSSVPFSPLGASSAARTAYEEGDPAAGLDEWAGGLDEFVGSDSGQPGYGPDDTEALLDATAGQYDEAVPDSFLDPAIDVVGQGHDGDTTDVLGPALFGTGGSVADVFVRRQGESNAGELGTSALLVGVVLLIVLYVVAPILGPLLEGVVGEA